VVPKEMAFKRLMLFEPFFLQTSALKLLMER